MRVSWAGVEATGSAVDLRGVSVSAERVATVVADPVDDRIRCGVPGPVVERVGVVSSAVSVSVRSVVAMALRSQRLGTPFDRALARAERRRARIEVPSVDVAGARAAVADADADVAAVREEVARLGGRVSALREVDADAAEAAVALEDAVGRLSELETERAAAEQRLVAARVGAREARDVWDRRRALADRVDNLRRQARDWLLDRYGDRFRAAVGAVPHQTEAGLDPSSFDGPDWVAALAGLRLADLAGPAVVGDDVGFSSADAAHRVVAGPTILVEV